MTLEKLQEGVKELTDLSEQLHPNTHPSAKRMYCLLVLCLVYITDLLGDREEEIEERIMEDAHDVAREMDEKEHM